MDIGNNQFFSPKPATDLPVSASNRPGNASDLIGKLINRVRLTINLIENVTNPARKPLNRPGFVIKLSGFAGNIG
jgi:hypothetical protein